jgi:signal transduction histidine kinase
VSGALDQVRSVKVKLGLLVAASVVVAAVVATIGSRSGVPTWLGIPVTVALALAVTQLLAVGMTSPLREMTAAARQMARGDHDVRVAATSRDEVGELARAFNSMAAELAGVDRQRRELVANVSHELRTPLAALTAVLENLVDGVGKPEPASLAAALEQAQRTSGLVNDLLDLSRVDAGKAPLTLQQVAVADLLESAVEEARMSGRSVEYAVSVTPEELSVAGDPGRLRQLVANLLDNASRHSPAGGLVSLRASANETDWTLEIADQGAGVPPEHRERVFERFGTLSAEDGGGGTGLGLAIARWVTDLHGGSIAFLDPEDGAGGARVRATLPRTPRERSRPEPVVPGPAPGPAPAPAPAPVASESLLDVLFGRVWPERGMAGDVRVVLAALAVGILAAIVVPYRDHGIGTFLLLLAAGGVVLGFAAHRRDPFTLSCAGLCVLLASATVLRDAEWIVVLCVLAGGALCMAGLVNGRSLPSFVLSGIAWPAAALRGLPWLGRSLRAVTGLGQAPAVVRAVAWSLLAVVVFGLLFASADALFAEWVGAVVPDIGSESLALRAFLTVAVTGVTLAAAYVALNPPEVELTTGGGRPAAYRFEWLAPVLVVDAVFAVFLVAQATVIFGGHDYLERTTGLTYADYSHQGFGQLTVATALTLLVVWGAARKARTDDAADRFWLRISLGLLCAMTLVVVGSALYRMHVYQEAYGFTRLRLLVDVFEGWLGLLVIAVMVAGLRLSAPWLARGALLSGASLLFLLAAINPDAWIAERNIERYDDSGEADWSYLRDLSEDALPTLATLPAEVRHCALARAEADDDDWLEWNLGRARAEDEPTAPESEWTNAQRRACARTQG